MIPSNPAVYVSNSTDSGLFSRFQSPGDRSDNSELRDWEYGGVAIQDPAEGLRYQIWEGYWNPSNSTAYLTPQDGAATPVEIFTELDVVEFTFSFDQNMRWCAATRNSSDEMKFRWYDTVSESYAINTYTGIHSVRLCHDDSRKLQVVGGKSDIILTYISAGQVCWRIQRDRYLIQYTAPGTYSSSYRITNFGMNTKNRLQWRIGPRRINL